MHMNVFPFMRKTSTATTVATTHLLRRREDPRYQHHCDTNPGTCMSGASPSDWMARVEVEGGADSSGAVWP